VAEPGAERARELLRETREELARADGKATTLLGVVGLLLGALLAGIIAGDWSPADLSCRSEVSFWIGAAVAVAAEGLLCAAVMPQLRHDKHRDHLTHFGHVVQFPDEGAFLNALPKADNDRVADQVWTLSRTVQIKYRFIQLGLLTFAGGLIVMVMAVGLDHL
jgi:MFS family permease